MKDEMSELRTTIRVIETALDPAGLYLSVQDPRAGAAVLFTGMVRDHSPGKSGITHLEYEAYGEHVESKINDITVVARERWDVLHIAVEHRTGIVALGDPTVVVAVSSAHRVEAFESARFIIDELKSQAPIWKKERWPGGAEWVEGA